MMMKQRDPLLRPLIHSLLGLCEPPSTTPLVAPLIVHLYSLGHTYSTLRTLIASARALPTHDLLSESLLARIETYLDEYAAKVVQTEQQVLRDPHATVARIKHIFNEELRSMPALLTFCQTSLTPPSALLRKLEQVLSSSSLHASRVFSLAYQDGCALLLERISMWISHAHLPPSCPFFFVHAHEPLQQHPPPNLTRQAALPSAYSLIPDRVPPRLLSLETARKIVQLGHLLLLSNTAVPNLAPPPPPLPVDRVALRLFIDELYTTTHSATLSLLQAQHISSQLHQHVRATLLLGSAQSLADMPLCAHPRGGSYESNLVDSHLCSSSVSVSPATISFAAHRRGFFWPLRKVLCERGFRVELNRALVTDHLSLVVTPYLDSDWPLCVHLTPDALSILVQGQTSHVSPLASPISLSIKTSRDSHGDMRLRVFKDAPIELLADLPIPGVCWTDAHGRAWFGLRGAHSQADHLVVEAHKDEPTIHTLDLAAPLPWPLANFVTPDCVHDLFGVFDFLLKLKRANEGLVHAWVDLGDDNMRDWRLYGCVLSVVSELQCHFQHDLCETALADLNSVFKDEACTNLKLAVRQILTGLINDSALADAAARAALYQVLEFCHAFATLRVPSLTFDEFAKRVKVLVRELERTNHSLVERIDYSGFWRGANTHTAMPTNG